MKYLNKYSLFENNPLTDKPLKKGIHPFIDLRIMRPDIQDILLDLTDMGFNCLITIDRNDIIKIIISKSTVPDTMYIGPKHKSEKFIDRLPNTWVDITETMLHLESYLVDYRYSLLFHDAGNWYSLNQIMKMESPRGMTWKRNLDIILSGPWK